MTNLSAEIVNFAAGDATFYAKFQDYYFHKSAVENGRKLGAYEDGVALSVKSQQVKDAFFAEVEKVSGVRRTAENAEAWMSNPMVKWANFAVLNATINSVLPAYVTGSLSPFVDFRTVSYGDIVHYRVKPRTLYTVSRGAHGERTTFRQKKYDGDVTVAPVEHIVTVYADMYRVLAGKEDIAEFVRTVVVSIEIEMNKDAVAALNAGLSAGTYPSQFQETGAFDPKKLISLGQRVQAYNMMAKPVVIGTAAALANVLPDSTLGYRGNFDANGGSVKVMKDFYGFDLIEIPQMPTGVNYGLALDDTKLYVVSPAMDKLVKGVMSNTLTNSNQFYENADLTQNFTMRKDWNFEFVSAAFAGVYTISQ